MERVERCPFIETAERGVAGDMGDGSQLERPSCDVSDGTDSLKPKLREVSKSLLSDGVRER